ncbi:MAG: IS5 family transposase [Rhodomicrobium sp.]
MKPPEQRETGQEDLFRSRLDQIIDLKHPLAKLRRQMDWPFLEKTFGAVYTDVAGRPPLPTQLMAGLEILKYAYNLSDERLCEAWLENPYFQYFCGEEFFRHALPFDRSSMTRWRQRMGEEKLKALLQESLAVAVKTGALKPAQLTEIVADTTVQPKNVMFPTDAKLMNRARERLVRLAKKHGVALRQTYSRVGKFALIKHQRYAHAKQFKRAGKSLRKLKTYLRRTIRDIARKIAGDKLLKPVFAKPLSLSYRVLTQKKRQKAPKVYSLHAPEVECIGKGKAHKPYEFGVKVSFATTIAPSKGGQFIVHAKALPGAPYDGHTLETAIPDIEATTGAALSRIIADAGYKGHKTPPGYTFKVYTQGQKRGVTDAIKRLFRRRAAIEPVIGHTKSEHRMERNYLAHRAGDAANAILAAAGYNFRRLIRWLACFLLQQLRAYAPA